ncbi:hypothetical protein [Nocardioides sp. TF02-7]|uniref:hypothetical protein n=1 Tax=Nocardioides sp. TF02-7 TaxID=2917724 RepID=UPI001F053A9C|nr:hypothetical protein [Nocardioides sp. TF02-7]UMG91499.1 hypothetical protein MF408_15400 [Nocardioides sp. TF02-7]
MSSEDDIARRVRFFGVQDLAAGWYVPRVAELVEQFDPANASSDAMDLIELHNVQQYLEHGFFPPEYTEAERATARSRIGQIRSLVASFFSSIDDANCAALISGVDHEYHADLLELLGRHKAYERCNATTMLRVLEQAGVHMSELLACKRLQAAYDAEVRDQLLASPSNAEHLVRKHLQKDVREAVHLPRSLSQADARDLLERYIDSPDANPNYVGLIESAPVSSDTGVDAKLKLRAKRRNAEMTEKFFENNKGFRTGTEVRLSDEQDAPVKFEMDDSDGLIARFTYSSRWLDETQDNPSILNNFQHLFEFADRNGLLTLPSYPAQLGGLRTIYGNGGQDPLSGGSRVPCRRHEQPPSDAAIPALSGAHGQRSRGSHLLVLRGVHRGGVRRRELLVPAVKPRSHLPGARSPPLRRDGERHHPVQPLGRERGGRSRPLGDHV